MQITATPWFFSWKKKKLIVPGQITQPIGNKTENYVRELKKKSSDPEEFSPNAVRKTQ